MRFNDRRNSTLNVELGVGQGEFSKESLSEKEGRHNSFDSQIRIMRSGDSFSFEIVK